MITQKTISDFLSTEYKEFAMYSIEGRAIPSMIDGFKPSQKSNTYLVRYGKQVMRGKIFQLAGKVASDAFIITVTPH
jgi:DNA gyrase/topoisomerase IV subunit A